LGLWPLAFLLIFLHFSILEVCDFAFLIAMGALATWATITNRTWVRFLIATFLFAVILICDFEYGPTARHVVSQHPHENVEFSKEFLRGVNAMLGAIGVYRLYIIVAVICLFSMSIACFNRGKSGTEKDKEANQLKQPPFAGA
jgi:hypothetical protein